MPESEAFAISTQQSHALGKTPKSYGTVQGKAKAKRKFDTPGDDVKVADPRGLSKKAGAGNFFKGIINPGVINPIIEDQTRVIVRDELAKRFQPIDPLPAPPKHDEPSAMPKTARIQSVSSLADGFSNELQKIAAPLSLPRVGSLSPPVAGGIGSAALAKLSPATQNLRNTVDTSIRTLRQKGIMKEASFYSFSNELQKIANFIPSVGSGKAATPSSIKSTISTARGPALSGGGAPSGGGSPLKSFQPVPGSPPPVRG